MPLIIGHIPVGQSKDVLDKHIQISKKRAYIKHEEVKKRMQQNLKQDDVLAHVQIKGDPDGRAQIYIDGNPVKSLIGYKIEHNSSDKRAPILTMQIHCTLEMDSGAIPLLPEPWSWFYEPKVPDFVDGHQFSNNFFPDPGTN